STVMKRFALCIISRTVVGDFSTKDQNSLYGLGRYRLVSYLRGKGRFMFEVLPASSFDLVTSLCTSLRRSFMRQSCIQNELVESDDKVSGSYGACSVQWCGAVEFSRMIEGVSGGFGSVGPGQASARCSQDPSWLVGAVEASVGGEPLSRQAEEYRG
ncbi:hypothetical protein BHM03_00049396, partial [Ensete ventricosum]